MVSTHPQYSKIYPELVKLLNQVLVLSSGSKGLIQIYDALSETLKVAASQGVGNEFLSAFSAIRAFDPTACGRCLGLKIPIVIDDVMQDKALLFFKHLINLEHIHSVCAMPLFDREKKVVGVISVYFSKTQYMLSGNREIPEDYLFQIMDLLMKLK